MMTGVIHRYSSSSRYLRDATKANPFPGGADSAHSKFNNTLDQNTQRSICTVRIKQCQCVQQLRHQ